VDIGVERGVASAQNWNKKNCDSNYFKPMINISMIISHGKKRKTAQIEPHWDWERIEDGSFCFTDQVRFPALVILMSEADIVWPLKCQLKTLL
jgi:hypothetical protein